MHPPLFHPDHLLSDWPDCRLELRCPKCGKSAFVPVRMLKGEFGDRTFRRTLKADGEKAEFGSNLEELGAGCATAPKENVLAQRSKHLNQ